MELRHLRYFVTIAEEKHITRAAARLGIAQPPLSQQLRALETDVGTALFERTPRGVVLTPAGEAFLPKARAALATAMQAAEDARLAAAGLRGTLNVGFVTSAALHPFVPALIRSFAHSHPDVRLEVGEGNAAELTERISTGSLDAALIRVPVGKSAQVMTCELLREKTFLALPHGHRLLSRWQPGAEGPRLALTQLADDPFILVRRAPAPGLYENLVQACRRSGFEPIIVAQVDRMLTNLSLVAAGVGVSAVPGAMRGIHAEQVAYCPIRHQADLAAPLTLLHGEVMMPAAERFVALAIARAQASADLARSQP